jgi:hypothetical protein
VGERAVGASVRAEDDPVRAEPDEGGAHVRDEILEKGARVPEITEIRSLRLSANSQIMRTALLEKMQESFINFARQNEDCRDLLFQTSTLPLQKNFFFTVLV